MSGRGSRATSAASRRSAARAVGSRTGTFEGADGQVEGQGSNPSDCKCTSCASLRRALFGLSSGQRYAAAPASRELARHAKIETTLKYYTTQLEELRWEI